MWWSLILCGVYYLAWTYQAWGWPAIDGYPTIERFIDPGYLTRDFYTNTSPTYGVDTVQAVLLGTLQQATGIHYAIALAALNLVRCLAFPAIVYFLFLSLAPSRFIALMGAVLGAISLFSLPRTMGWAWVWGDTSTAMIAVPAMIVGWAYVLKRRASVGMLWFAFVAAVHPLTAVHGLIVLGLVFLVDYSPSERLAALRSPATLASTALFGVVFLGQYLLLKTNGGSQLPVAEYFTIVARERHPTDFLPSLFPTDVRLAFALCASATCLALWQLWAQFPHRRLVVAVLVTYACICVAGYYFVEVWPVRFWIELMPYRTANLAAPFMLFVMAVYEARLIEQGRFAAGAALALTYLVASPVAERLRVLDGDNLAILAGTAQLGIVAAAGSSGRVVPAPVERLASTIFARRLRPVGALLLTGFAVYGMQQRAGAFTIPTVENQHPIYAWMKQHTPETAVFLVDQFSSDRRYRAAVNPQKLRLVGRRAVVASLDFPFLDRDMSEWYTRWQKVLVGSTPDRVDTASVETTLELQREFPFDYVVRRTPFAPDPRLELVAEFRDTHGVQRVLVYHIADAEVHSGHAVQGDSGR